jgi:hypothetical protein
MARPQKHPKTGIYWFRKVVPAKLRSLVGKREVKQSLRTRDPAEAKRLHLEALARLETRWANLQTGPKCLSEREAHMLAEPIYNQWIAQHRDNPSQQKFWQTNLGSNLWPSPLLFWDAKKVELPPIEPLSRSVFRLEMEAWCEQHAKDCLTAHGLVVDDESRLKLAKAIAAAVQRASLVLAQFAQGDYSQAEHPDNVAAAPTKPERPRSKEAPLTFDTLIQGWADERQPKEKTIYEWRRVMRKLTDFLGHNDARRLTPDDFVRWKQSLIAAGQRSKTIRDAKLTPAKSILGWAAKNRLIETNPAAGIDIDVKTRAAETKRGFSEDEAATTMRLFRSAALRGVPATERGYCPRGRDLGVQDRPRCRVP